MTASIPNGFSQEQLQELMNRAAERDLERLAKAQDGPYNGLTRDQICDHADQAIDAINEINGNALVHKIVVLNIINNYIDWHNACAFRLIDEGNHLEAAGWLRDAGKFQSIMNLLTTVGVHPLDFTTTWYEADDE